MNAERKAGGMPEQGFEVIDPGHQYRLGTLDGCLEQVLTFVKRCDPEHPERFPGNTNSYPGTTLQCVMRVLVDRVTYLQNQIPCAENEDIIALLRQCLFLLETRAARRHGHTYHHLSVYAQTAPLCPQCGHTDCRSHAQHQ